MEQRITNKARELFFRYGLKSVTMDDIATNLGVSKKTIYQYYTDKDSIVEAVMLFEIQRGEKECNQYSNQSENAVHEVFMTIDMMQEMLSTMNPSLIFEMQKYHPNAFKMFNDHKHQFIYQTIKANLERGQREELYRQELNAEVLAKYRVETLFLPFSQDVFPMAKFNIFQVSLELMNHFLFGITTPKGQKLITKYKQAKKTSI